MLKTATENRPTTELLPPPASPAEGLRDPKIVQRFADRMRGLQDTWPSLSQGAREHVIADTLNTSLRAGGVPEVRIESDSLGTTDGEFELETWTVVLNESIVSKDTIDSAALAALTNTVFHEARHAEQWYMVARHLSEIGVPTWPIGIRSDIVHAAVAEHAPLTPDQKATAERFTESLVGQGARHRDDVLVGLKTHKVAVRAARDARDKIADDRNVPRAEKDAMSELYTQARDAQDRNYQAYRSLPEEADAWQAGDSAERAMRRGPLSRLVRRWSDWSTASNVARDATETHEAGPGSDGSLHEPALKDLGTDPAATRDILLEDHADLEEGNPAGLQEKLDKLKTSEFVFLRGTGGCSIATSRAWTRPCRSCRPTGTCTRRFGIIQGDEGKLFFGLNDFDESAKAPFTWDLRRGVTAFELAARDKNIPADQRSIITQSFLEGYSEAMKGYAGKQKANRPAIDASNAASYSKVVADLLAKAGKVKRSKFLAKRVDIASQKFLSTDAITPVSDRLPEFQASLAKYAKAHGFSTSDIVDVATKSGSGTASLGTERYYILVRDKKGPEFARILEIKEEGPSVLEKAGVLAKKRSAAERVVKQQQIQSPHGDPYYGATEVGGKSFLVRERSPYKKGLELAETDLTPEDFAGYAKAAGVVLAQAHANSGKIDGESSAKAIDHALDDNLRSDISQWGVDEADHVGAQFEAFVAADARAQGARPSGDKLIETSTKPGTAEVSSAVTSDSPAEIIPIAKGRTRDISVA